MNDIDVDDPQEFFESISTDIKLEFAKLNKVLSKHDDAISSILLDKLKQSDIDIQKSIDDSVISISAEINKQQIDEFELSSMKNRAFEIKECLDSIKQCAAVAKLVNEMIDFSLCAQQQIDDNLSFSQRIVKDTNIAHASYSFCQIAEKLENNLIEYENSIINDTNNYHSCNADEKSKVDLPLLEENSKVSLVDKALPQNTLVALYELISKEREMVAITLLSWLTSTLVFENNGTTAKFTFSRTLLNREATSARLSALLILGDYEHRFTNIMQNLFSMLRYCVEGCDVQFTDTVSSISSEVDEMYLIATKSDKAASAVDRLCDIVFITRRFHEVIGQTKVLEQSDNYTTFSQLLGQHSRNSFSSILQTLSEPESDIGMYDQIIRIVGAIEVWWRKIGFIRMHDNIKLPQLVELSNIICNSKCAAFIAQARSLIAQNVADLVEISEITKIQRSDPIHPHRVNEKKKCQFPRPKSEPEQRLDQFLSKSTNDLDADLIDILNLISIYYENEADFSLSTDMKETSKISSITQNHSNEKCADESQNQSTTGLIDSMVPPSWTTPNCRISTSMAQYVHLLEDCLEHACATREPNHAGKYFETARCMLELYAILPNKEANENITTVPLIAAVLYNNYHFLGHAAAILGAFYCVRITEATDFTSTLTLVDFVPKLRSLGDDALRCNMKESKTTLRHILDDRDLYFDLDSGNKQLMGAIKQAILIVAQRINALKQVLSNTVLAVSRCTLTRYLLDRLVVNVVALEDIPADDATRLAEVLTFALKEVKEKCFDDPIGAQLELERSATRITELCLILNGSLLDISNHWCNAKGPLADTFSQNDVESLVRALFQNSTQRAELIKELRTK